MAEGKYIIAAEFEGSLTKIGELSAFSYSIFRNEDKPGTAVICGSLISTSIHGDLTDDTIIPQINIYDIRDESRVAKIYDVTFPDGNGHLLSLAELKSELFAVNNYMAKSIEIFK